MINQFNINKALLDHLLTIPDYAQLETVIIDGSGAELPTRGVYIVESVIPNTTQTPALNPNDSNVGIGIYQLDVRTPRGSNKWLLVKWADKVAKHFKRGTDIRTIDDVKVNIDKSYQSPMMGSEQYQRIIVSVEYQIYQ